MIDLTDAVGRLDRLADFAQRIARAAQDDRWPRVITVQAETLSRTLQEHAGALDTANDQPSARAALAQARAALPDAFHAFGRAIAEELATGTKLNTYRRRPKGSASTTTDAE